MRVIAGSAKRLQLKTLDGMETRPTTDRIKETLFNMISPYIYDSIFLDLFSGSGGIGIEALSRGAKEAVFVEKNPRAMECIKENLKYTKLEGEKTFDYIFMDPPYNQELEKMVLSYLSKSELVYEDTVIIVEASLDTEFSYLEQMGFRMIKTKEYKTNKHVFIEKEGKQEIC